MSNILMNNKAHTFMLNGKRYVNSFGGGGEPTPTIPPIGYTIFKDGEFYNQDIATLNITNYTIEDGCIKLHGSSFKGYCIDDCNLTTNYILLTVYKNTVADDPYCQSGRSSLHANIPDIVGSGTGRISYTNFQSNRNVNMCVTTLSLNGQNSEGAFLSVGSDTYIEEIAIIPCDTHVVAN